MVIVLGNDREFYKQNIRHGSDKQHNSISAYKYNSTVRKNYDDINVTVNSLLNDIDTMLNELTRKG